MPDAPAETGRGQDDDELLEMAYDHLRGIAAAYMKREDPGATIQATALVHEAWLRLGDDLRRYNDRTHFLVVASRAMRRILVDEGRRRRADKRGGGRDRVTLSIVGDRDEPSSAASGIEPERVEAALRDLAEIDARKAQVVELRMYGGLGDVEIAAALGVARSTVAEDWRLAKSFLALRLAEDPR